MKNLLEAIKTDAYNVGTIKNCRWMYSPRSGYMATGVLSLASDSNFDRWANSRIIEIHTILWDSKDPDIEKVIQAIVDSFGEAEVKYGCHVDVDDYGLDVLDDCVLDPWDSYDCLHQLRHDIKKKEDCEYWRPIK